MLELAKKIIKEELDVYSFAFVDTFEYGESKIEFMVMSCNEVIAISLVNDLSYDFTVFDMAGEKILYNNTQKLESLYELKKVLNHNLNEIINI